MAKFDGKYFSGPIGPVIFRRSKSGQVVYTRPAPGSIRHTEATKRASGTFGIISKLASHLKDSFATEIFELHDGTLYTRMVKQLSLVLYECRDPETGKYQFEKTSFNKLAGFDFNIDSPVVKKLGILPIIDQAEGTMSIVFPDPKKSTKLKFIKGSTYCDMTVGITFVRLADGLRTRQPITQVQRLYKDATDRLNGKRFDFVVPDGCLCVVSVFLKYYNNKTLLNSKMMSPAFICDATITDGIYVEDKKDRWVDMRIKLE